MTARRGSFRFKVQRLARAPLRRVSRDRAWQRRLTAWTRLMSRLVAGAAALFVAVAFGAQMWHVGMQNYRLHKQIEGVENKNASLESDSVRLSRQIELLHDPDYLVPLIHEQLGLVKPHEVFIEFQPAPAPTEK